MAIALVRAGSIASASTTTITPAFGTATTAGHLLLAAVFTNTTSSITCSISGWTEVAVALPGGGIQAALWYKPNCSASETAPTFTCPSATTIKAGLAEFSGVATTSPLDQSGVVNAKSSPVVAAASAPDTYLNDLAVAMAGWGYSTSNTGTVGSSSGWTDLANNASASAALHLDWTYLVNTAGGFTPDTNTMTYSGSVSAVGSVVATFKSATPTSIDTAAVTLAAVSTLTDSGSTKVIESVTYAAAASASLSQSVIDTEFDSATLAGVASLTNSGSTTVVESDSTTLASSSSLTTSVIDLSSATVTYAGSSGMMVAFAGSSESGAYAASASATLGVGDIYNTENVSVSMSANGLFAQSPGTTTPGPMSTYGEGYYDTGYYDAPLIAVDISSASVVMAATTSMSMAVTDLSTASITESATSSLALSPMELESVSVSMVATAGQTMAFIDVISSIVLMSAASVDALDLLDTESPTVNLASTGGVSVSAITAGLFVLESGSTSLSVAGSYTQQGSVLFPSVASLNFNAIDVQWGIVGLSGMSLLAISTSNAESAAVLEAGMSSLSAMARVTEVSTVLLVPVTTLSVTSKMSTPASVVLGGVASLSSMGIVGKLADVALSATGTLSIVNQGIVEAAALFAPVASLTVILLNTAPSALAYTALAGESLAAMSATPVVVQVSATSGLALVTQSFIPAVVLLTAQGDIAPLLTQVYTENVVDMIANSGMTVVAPDVQISSVGMSAYAYLALLNIPSAGGTYNIIIGATRPVTWLFGDPTGDWYLTGPINLSAT